MNTQPKIIVVAGANGQLGQPLVAALADRAARKGEMVEVRARVRKGRGLPTPAPGLTRLAMDYASATDLERACAGAMT